MLQTLGQANKAPFCYCYWGGLLGLLSLVAGTLLARKSCMLAAQRHEALYLARRRQHRIAEVPLVLL